MALHPENEKRVDWVTGPMDAFARETFYRPMSELCADDQRDCMSDLICNLGHLCTVLGLDYAAVLSQAASNYEHESDPDYQGD